MLSPHKMFLLWFHARLNIGTQHFFRLVNRYQNVESVIQAIKNDECDFDFLSFGDRKKLIDGEYLVEADEILQKYAQAGISVIFQDDRCYPTMFKLVSQPPLIIYCRGNTELLNTPSVAMIGSRKSTKYGRDCAREFALEAAKAGITVVSGMAKGIDAQCHIGALEAQGSTIAVLGSGVDCIYPVENTAIYEKIVANGAVISEYPPGTRPLKGNFPARNRLIIGLCKCLLVLEAALPSGTMSTVDHALAQNKDVFCVPGNITSPSSAGTNYLIKTGAFPALSPADILLEFGIKQVKHQTEKPTALNGLEKQIVALLFDSPQSGEELENAIDAGVAEINTALTMLELNGIIAQDAGRIFTLNSKFR